MRLRDARWLLLGIFLVGFIVCQQSLGNVGPGFVGLSLLDAGACALLLARLAGPIEETLWAWIGLLLLLDGYFIRMYWIAHNLNHPRYIDTYYVELRWLTRGRVLAGFPWASAGFVFYCIAVSAILTFGRTASPPRSRTSRSPMAPWTQLVVALLFVYLLASLLQFRLGFGVRGVANPSLPFHLGTIMTLAREGVIPGLLVTALWVFDGRDARWERATLFVILLCGVMASFLSASRGGLILLTLPVFFLWMLTRRFDMKRKWASAGVVLIAAILVPIVSAYRTERVSGKPSSATGISEQQVMKALFFLGDRAGDGGIDSVWFSLDHKGHFSLTKALSYMRPSALNNYYTRQVVGVRDPNDHRDAGMLGAFIIIGSGFALMFLTASVLALIWALWTGLRRLEIWPVALALAGGSVALLIVDPTDALLTVTKLLLEVGACEFVYRQLAPRRSNRVRAGVEVWRGRGRSGGVMAPKPTPTS